MDINPGSAAEFRTWLTTWVARTAGARVEDVDPDAPMQSLGLSSRDVVVLSGELENLTGMKLDATVAYEYPTINTLSEYLSTRRDASSTGSVTSTADGVHEASCATAATNTAGRHDIAIVGLAARLPGAASAEEAWDRIVSGEVCIGDLPAGRWSEYDSDDEVRKRLRSVPTRGGYLEDIASFDNEFFGLSPVEAANMDPQQRITLELTWEALENAGIPANELRGSRTGVYMGSSNNDYGMLIAADPAEMHPYALTGTSSAIVANRISYAFDFRGPSLNVDTACSSSLVAIHQAVRDLRQGDADTAIAGGVNILASPFVSIGFGELGVTSPEGIKAFSDDAAGIVRSDGAGVLVLKRVEDAIAAGDTILAVIKGSAVNSDGRSNGLTAPNPVAQADVLRRAYQDADVPAGQVDYLEAHGTGTILGDPIEAQALGEVLGYGRDADHPLLLGSAKTNFGHTESAAGVAGVIKVVLSMLEDTVPPLAGFHAPNRYIDFNADHLEPIEDPREWPEYGGRKTAGVSGFGFGGTNAHLVLSEYVPDDYPQPSLAENKSSAENDTPGAARHLSLAEREEAVVDATTGVVLQVSGLMPSRRRRAAAVMAEWLASHPHTPLTDVARATARRNHGRSRAAIVAKNMDEAVKRLRLVADGKSTMGIAQADSPATLGPVFVYSGFGSQHRKMAKDLCAVSPRFVRRLRELDDIIIAESGWSLLDIINDDAQTYGTETAQVAITAIQIALTDLLAYLGAKPAAVMGMSMGEIAAGYAAGGLSDRDAMIVACHRSALMGEGENSLSDDQLGAMAVVQMTCDELPEGIEPAVYAAPGMLTVGGSRDAVQKLVEELEGKGTFARLLNVKGAGHTSALDPILGELYAEVSEVEAHPLQIPLYSSVDRGTVYPAGSVVHTPEYWVRCTRYPVRFQDATEKAFADGYSTMVEIAPNPVALMAMMNTAFSVGRSDAQLLYTLKRKVDPSDSLRDLTAKLYATGQPINFSRLFGAGNRAPIPGLTWKKQRLWTSAHPCSGRSRKLPGSKVTLPDGTVAYSIIADVVPSSHALIEAAAADLLPEARVTVVDDYQPLPARGEITTTASCSLGGVDISVYVVSDTGVERAARGFATVETTQSASPTDSAAGAGSVSHSDTSATDSEQQGVTSGETIADASLWDPQSGETVEERLRSIVSESMGYDVEDLPGELPLIDLGLDSLMGMRIKNRVEHDFQIPPLQVQALRDASVADVVGLVTDTVNGKQPSEGKSSVSAASVDANDPQSRTQLPEDSASETINGVGVAPRDASERLVFATWAAITGKAPAGVTSPLPGIPQDTATAIAARLTERCGMEVSVDCVQHAGTLEVLANTVREGLETEVEGTIRVLRERPEGSTAPAVFLFHPAGGSSVVYQPLTRRLPEDVPVYGVERLEGTFAERAAVYVEDVVRQANGFPIVLGGWSFGGALAMEVARQLKGTDNEPILVVMLDTVQPSEPIPDTPEETKARWQRYAAFAKKTYGLDVPVPYDLLDSLGEDAMLSALTTVLNDTDPREHGLSAGVLEHQRASFVDNRILATVDFTQWSAVTTPVVLFRAERMHEGAIELEPRYATIDEDGGWASILDDLEIVHLKGDHLAIVDEPEIAKVGVHITRRLSMLGR